MGLYNQTTRKFQVVDFHSFTAALREPHVGVFDITGRPMKNWVLVGPDGVEDPLRDRIRRAEAFVGTLPGK